MFEKRKLIYWLLFGVFFLLEAIHLFPHLIPAGSPVEWIKPLGHYAPIALALLLVFIIRITEHEKERLEKALVRGSDLVSTLTKESTRVSELSARTE